MSLLLAQAAVNDANIHFDKLYSYRIPAELAGRVFPGSMVLVPFGRGSKARMAVVLAVGEVDESDAPKGLKTLYDAAPEDARLTPDLLELVRFLKERTFCTWFEAVKAVIPYGAQYRPAVVDGRHVMQGRLTRSTERLYTLAGALPEKPKPGPRQLAAVAALQNGPLTARQLDEVGISRATLDGLVKKGEAFMGSDTYKELVNGVVDARNSLNDLTGKDWLPETKSFFYQKGLGANHPEAQIEKLHPAPYSFQDIGHLVNFFTKHGMSVLDPFGGVGSTAKACEVNGRICTSIELSPVWHELSIKRLENEVGEGSSQKHHFINGDSCEELLNIPSESMDFMVTSPPYWGILNKQDQKVKKNRVANNLETKYSESEKDLGNVENYEEFLDILVGKIFLQCARTLRYGKYMAIVVSDFRDKSEYISFHSDLIHALNKAAIPDGGVLKLQGTKILLQNHKSLLPYGYPFAYVENIHHQYVLIFRKEKK